MKKFLVAISILLIGTPAAASWTQEQRDDFYQMLYRESSSQGCQFKNKYDSFY